MSRRDSPGGEDGVRCPECGVTLRGDAKRCEFCGRKVVPDVPPGGASPARRGARGTFAWVAIAAFLVGAFLHFRSDSRDAGAPTGTPPGGGGAKRDAAAACEERVRGLVKAPLRVIAFRTSLVAEEHGGFAVSGTVEVQSLDGVPQRKRYFCSVRPDERAGLAVGESSLE